MLPIAIWNALLGSLNIFQFYIGLFDMEIELPVNVRSIISNIKDALQLNAIPKDDIKEYVLTAVWV